MNTTFENLAIYPDSELELIRLFMQDEGISESQWLFGSGLSPKQNPIGANSISLKQFDVIYRNVYRLAQRPSLGIDFGLALNLSRWGMLTSALLCAQNLGHALLIADEFREILRSRFEINSHEKGKYLVLTITPKNTMDYPVSEHFAYDVFLGSLTTQISQLLGQDFRFSEVHLALAKPLHTKHYQKISQQNVKFGATITQLILPMALMNHALPLSNRVTSALALAQCRAELERIQQAKAGDIVFMVRDLLAQYQGTLPKLTTIAQHLSLSPRTLRRRLQDQQVQFRQLCEQQRQQTALAMLNKTETPVSDVASLCGFADTVSFQKAFKRWTGETPSQYRQRLYPTTTNKPATR